MHMHMHMHMLYMSVTRVPAHRARQLPWQREGEAVTEAVERRVARGTHESRLVRVCGEV